VSVPATPGELDAAWLEEALRGDGALSAARVRGVSSVRIGEGYGWDAQIARLTIDGIGTPPTLVAKWGTAETVAVEARFARDVAPRIDVATPRVFGARIDGRAGKGLLFLEDIAPAKQGDHLVGATDAEVAAVVDATAAVQAAFWGRTDDAAVAWLPRWKPGEAPEDRVRRTAAAVPAFLHAWRARLSPAAQVLVEALPERLAESLAALDGSPAALLHADLHLENVLFRPDGTPVVLDWTDASIGPAAADFAWVLVFSQRAMGPRAERDALAARWAAELARRGVAGYGVERLTRDAAHASVSLLALEVRNAVAAAAPPSHPRIPATAALARRCAAEGAAALLADWGAA
jgi:aminoglycoside phosphotransferase (APT) family kinase protein